MPIVQVIGALVIVGGFLGAFLGLCWLFWFLVSHAGFLGSCDRTFLEDFPRHRGAGDSQPPYS
jgi:hypothetical protein